MVRKQEKGRGNFATVDSWVDGTGMSVTPFAIAAVTAGPGRGVYVVGFSVASTVVPVRGSWIVRRPPMAAKSGKWLTAFNSIRLHPQAQWQLRPTGWGIFTSSAAPLRHGFHATTANGGNALDCAKKQRRRHLGYG